MANIDLTQYGITGATEIIHNPSYDELFKDIKSAIINKNIAKPIAIIE